MHVQIFVMFFKPVKD